MLHSACSLVLEVLTEIDDPQISVHILRGDIAHPSWNCRREQADLKFFTALVSHRLQDLVYVFLESELEHLVSFIQNDGLDMGEVNVSPLNMVENSSCRADKEIDTAAKLACLILDGDTTVNGECRELILGVLQSLKFSGDLLRKKNVKLSEVKFCLISNLPGELIHVWGPEQWLEFCAFRDYAISEVVRQWAGRRPGSFRSR